MKMSMLVVKNQL